MTRQRRPRATLPINKNKYASPPLHDPSIDERVIEEFVKRFPRLQFHSFQRNRMSASSKARTMHCIRFAGTGDDLVAAGLPAAGIATAYAEGFASSPTPTAGGWALSLDRRRKEGRLGAQLWVYDRKLGRNHPFAWLEPRHWRQRR